MRTDWPDTRVKGMLPFGVPGNVYAEESQGNTRTLVAEGDEGGRGGGVCHCKGIQCLWDTNVMWLPLCSLADKV